LYFDSHTKIHLVVNQNKEEIPWRKNSVFVDSRLGVALDEPNKGQLISKADMKVFI